jgi:hypothetical protein
MVLQVQWEFRNQRESQRRILEVVMLRNVLTWDSPTDR